MNLPIGTLVNTATVIVGSGIGLLLHGRLAEKYQKITFQAIGLCTLLLGMQMAFRTENILLVIASMVLGGLLGEALALEDRFARFGDWVKRKIKSKNERFTEGMITSFMLFCVGSLTIIGSLEEGLTGDASLIYTKSVLDGFASMFLATGYGVGVMCTAGLLFLFQGSLTLGAGWVEPWLSEEIIREVSATGGVMILGLGIVLMEVKKIKITNFLPALLVIVILIKILNRFFLLT